MHVQRAFLRFSQQPISGMYIYPSKTSGLVWDGCLFPPISSPTNAAPVFFSVLFSEADPVDIIVRFKSAVTHPWVMLDGRFNCPLLGPRRVFSSRASDLTLDLCLYEQLRKTLEMVFWIFDVDKARMGSDSPRKTKDGIILSLLGVHEGDTVFKAMAKEKMTLRKGDELHAFLSRINSSLVS